jgi:hypothetical protein
MSPVSQQLILRYKIKFSPKKNRASMGKEENNYGIIRKIAKKTKIVETVPIKLLT